MAATIPPMSIQTALSVGAPVKNFERSELKEFMAWMPKKIRTIPPTVRAIDTSLFINERFCSGGECSCVESWGL